MFKKTFAFILLMFVALASRAEVYASQSDAASVDAQQNPETYRRSSLCIILVTHQGTKYAEDMERQFLKMKLPERYNEHNIQLRVLHTNRSLNSKDIVRKLQSNEVGKQLVAKWFNRNPYTGVMNMDLIHDRGGFNATMSDAERADLTVRGRSLLQEEGVDLIQNTFVLVCDMQYKKRDDAGVWAALGTGLLAAGLDALGQYSGTDMSSSTSQLYEAAGELSDLSGFSVIMDAHLLQLDWTSKDLNRLYTNYWVDETTPAVEAQAHKANFDRDANSFKLNYLGHYKSRSTKIEMESSYGFDDLILDVTDRTVAKSIKELALMYPQFKPKTPLVHTSNGLVAYVGTKENITNKTKFDVVESVKKNGEIKYNKVGRLKVIPGMVWDNKNIRMDEISDLSSVPGTRLKGSNDKYADQPYMLVESGKSRLGGMKKVTFDCALRFEYVDVEDAIEERIREKESKSFDIEDPTSFMSVCFIDMGCTWNINRNFSWNIMEGKLGLGSMIDMGVGTGLTWRFANLNKKKTASLFLQPTVGLGYLISMTSSIAYKTYGSSYSSHKDVGADFTYLDWNLRLGMNYKKFFVSVGTGPFHGIALRTGFHL